jgi:hypothetical protein
MRIIPRFQYATKCETPQLLPTKAQESRIPPSPRTAREDAGALEASAIQLSTAP